ncbi:MAG TPA: UTP--glucose-1-phosphate uridylyltransferase [Caulobacteraceae bacterium]|nr:UTP--glucose-1-phosphate uridylyltransferase [Caulobacteraceae bacterium]
MQRVRKVVIPAAGLGTRTLPASKVTPKNLLNVFDRPMIAHVVAEARAAGAEHFVFVIGRGQGGLEETFDHAFELEATLAEKGKTELLDAVRAELGPPGEFSFVRQMTPGGLGHAVWCARHVVGDEPFAVMLPDMLMVSQPPALGQAIAAREAVGGNVILVEPAPPGEAHKYGIVDLGETASGFDGRLHRLSGMVEKPAPGTEPSNLFISGRYVLEPEIFEVLGRQGTGALGELQLTDAMMTLLGSRPFHALEYRGVSYDCGDILGLLRANIAFALADAERGAAARALTEELLKAPPLRR